VAVASVAAEAAEALGLVAQALAHLLARLLALLVPAVDSLLRRQATPLRVSAGWPGSGPACAAQEMTMVQTPRYPGNLVLGSAPHPAVAPPPIQVQGL